MVLVNDWSARDIQSFETRPLGPFLGKSFLTSVSPWVVPLAALEPAFVDPPAQDPRPLDHLQPAGPALDLALEVRLNGQLISRPPAAALYWTAAQQLAHLTGNGASLRTGDLYASGTVSGDAPDQLGSLLELTRGGHDPLHLPDGTHPHLPVRRRHRRHHRHRPGPGGTRIALGTVSAAVVGWLLVRGGGRRAQHLLDREAERVGGAAYVLVLDAHVDDAPSSRAAWSRSARRRR